MKFLRVAAMAACLLAAGCVHFSPDRPRGGRLMDDVRVLSADDMQGREIDTKGSIKARNYILRRFKQEGLRPLPSGWLQPFRFTPKDGAEIQGVNVMGYVRGRRHPDRFIVVTAHYDHVGVGDDGQIHNGADDNASGVAALFEMARQLKSRRPDHSILFVAFDGEEYGMRGARAFMAAPPVPPEAMALNINLDMIGRLDKGEIYAAGTWQFPRLKPVLEAAAQGSKATLLFGHDRPEDAGGDNWVLRSDQEPFYRAGIPFVFFSVEDHADYHAPTDDPERIPVPFFEAAVEMIGAALRRFDQMDLETLKVGARPPGS